MLRRLFAAFAILCLSACASAQEPEVVLPNLNHLKRHATESFNIDLGPARLGLAAWLMGKSDDPDSSALRNTLAACKSVQVRHYEFAPDFDYPREDIDAIRLQPSGHGWSSLVTSRDRKARENADVYIRMQNERITGFVVLASGPRELTIVNIAGSFDLDEIEKLRTHFSAPVHGKSGTEDESPRS